MSEEEKEAIELLESLCSDDCINKDIITTVKNLIEKQQQKIEELKEDLSQKVKALDIAMSNPDYICKDKIRKTIEDALKELLEE